MLMEAGDTDPVFEPIEKMMQYLKGGLNVLNEVDLVFTGDPPEFASGLLRMVSGVLVTYHVVLLENPMLRW